MAMCLFCHFDILGFEFHASLTIWNIKYIKISCLLSADGAGARCYFLFLSSFVDGASAYFFKLIFQFSFQTSERIRRPMNQCGVALAVCIQDKGLWSVSSKNSTPYR